MEMQCGAVQMMDQDSESDRSAADDGEKGSLVAMVKAMPLFQFCDRRFIRFGAERPGIEQTVRGIEHPHGYEHRGDRGRQVQSNAPGDEPCP